LEVLQNVKFVGGKENKQMTDLNEFVEWSRNNPRCKVEIEIGDYGKEDAGEVKIWVFNSILMTGQFVSSVDEIDIDAEYRKKMELKKQEVEEYFQKERVV